MTSATPVANAHEIVAFWRDLGRERWFGHDEEVDRLCRERFLPAYEAAAAGELAAWEDSAEGALALLILLDQMPRNMFRGAPGAWATDPLAQRIASDAIARGFDRATARELRQFFYLPFMHAEDTVLQARSLGLYEGHGDPENLAFARHHHDIVARFGRFPHRNAALGRASTPEELAFLEEDGFRG
jgi:uncharacterized protein (DUF924 family)